MTDYTLYYWPIPFRGQLVRAVLAHVRATWEEAGVGALVSLKDAAPAGQLVPHMGPPVLTDHAAGLSLAQTPAILAYLGGKHGLIPDDPARDALTVALVSGIGFKDPASIEAMNHDRQSAAKAAADH